MLSERLKTELSTNSYDPKTSAIPVSQAWTRVPADIVFSIGAIVPVRFMVRLLTGARAIRPAPRLAAGQPAE
ncbi:hypothetical protein K5P26_05015 [Sphingopyxis sp. XHP0097]|uniref:Uncharacterized protein n=1 Tax=Sphingopyxis jiangsuensis TaxID=2871171 RepID=A0ABS7MCU8_9SPHN|nr:MULTISPECIES: hypothetical protein [Sphingopyxis]MBY4636499.1 hypothetical protein [Sphingopyxis jiangsuensis]